MPRGKGNPKRRRTTTRPPQVSYDRVRALEERLAAVRAIGEALATAVGLDALFEEIVPNVTRLMNAQRSTLFLYSESSGEIWSKIAEGEGGREIRLPLGRGIAGHVAQTLQTVNIQDAYAAPRFNRDIDARTGFRTRSVACAPVLDRAGKLLGVLQVLNHKDGPFTEDDIGLLETIAVQMAYAVENARQAQTLIDQNRELEAARQRAERRRAELDLLYQLEQETSASSDLDALLDSVIVRACERLRSQAGSVLLRDEHTGKLFFRGVSGERKEELKRLSLAPGEGIVGWVAEHGEPLVVNHPEDDPRHDAELAKRIDYPATALLCVPLIWLDEVIGAVEVLNPRPRPTGAIGYDDEDLKVLTLIAAQLARAVALTRERQARIETERLAFLGRMLAGVAHDLRNPMTVISGYAQIMAVEEQADLRRARCERVLHQIDEMTAMVADLLAFARGDSRLKAGEVDVARLGAELEETLGVHCTPRGILLEIEAPPGRAHVDPSRARRIITNLAKNAIDVLARDGRLVVALRAVDGGLEIRVTDTGPGIPERDRARMFDPFFTANKDNGTGLGLSIVKRFVDDHGGRIEIDSTVGKGTSFLVVLPEAPRTPIALVSPPAGAELETAS